MLICAYIPRMETIAPLAAFAVVQFAVILLLVFA
jgi:hypothetical protein